MSNSLDRTCGVPFLTPFTGPSCVAVALDVDEGRALIKKKEGRMDSEPIKTTRRSQFETFPMEVGVSKKESYFQPNSAKIHTATVVSA